MILSFLFLLLSLIIICLVVFGGGQVFIPLFIWLWKSLNTIFGINITQEQIDTVITISNSTPGVVSTKFGFLSGYLFAEGKWWGWITIFLTYLTFALPAIIMTIFVFKLVNKNSKNGFMSKIINYSKPIIAGIMIALAAQLFISLIFPFIGFNNNYSEYITNINNDKTRFFQNWRLIALFIYVPINIVISFIMYYKKMPLFYLMIISIISSLIVFQPWI